jgi:hypothetical protein
MKKAIAVLFLFLLLGQAAVLAAPAPEDIVRQGAANLQRNLEPVSGNLYLTKTQLIFEAEGLNLQRCPAALNLSDVVKVETGWSKLLGLVPALPNALKITMKDGQVYRYTCFKSWQWAAAVTAQLPQASG